MTEPDPLVADYLFARAAYDEAKARYDELAERVMKQMEADQRKTISWRDNISNQVHVITFVRGHTVTINEAGLRRALKAKVFDRYTKRVLDRKKMEEAMDTGEVDPKVVAQYTDVRPNKPYLKYTSRQPSE